MVKFFTKTVCIAFIAALCVGSLTAQTANKAPTSNMVKSEIVSPQSQGKILSAAEMGKRSIPDLPTSGRKGLSSERIRPSREGEPMRGFTIPSLNGKGPGSIAYGMDDDMWDLVKFPLDDVGNYTHFDGNPYLESYVTGADYVDGYWYAISEYTSEPYIYKIDPNTGSYTKIIHNCYSYVTFGMAYNDVEEQMYIVACDANFNDPNLFYKVDLNTGTIQYAFTVTQGGYTMYDIAFTNEGDLIGIAVDFGASQTHIVKINPSDGSLTILITPPFFSKYEQSLALDREDGMLYWTVDNFSETIGRSFYQIDLSSNTLTKVCNIPSAFHYGIVGLAIPAVSGPPMDPCPVVTNVTATLFEGNKVLVEWVAAPGDVTEYKIYQNGTEKGTVPAGTTTWTSGVLASGTYTFAVAAVYDETCKPQKVAAAPITIATCNDKVTGVAVAYDADCATATISWNDLNGKKTLMPNQFIGNSINMENTTVREASQIPYAGPMMTMTHAGIAPPKTPNAYIKWTTGVIDDALGNSDYPINMIGGSRYLPADLVAKNVTPGDVITKVKFGIKDAVANPTSSYVIKIYEGGSSPSKPGVLKYQQTVTQTLYANTQNEVTLTTPFLINPSIELMVAIHVTCATPGYYLAVDAGPCVAGKGDVICWNGDWSALSDLGFMANWNIETYVTQGTGTLNLPAAPNPFTATAVGSQLKANLAWTNPSTTISGGTLGSIQKIVLERNGTPIKDFTSVTPGQQMTYTDSDVPTSGEYYYTVYAVNSDGTGLSAYDWAIIGPVCPISVVITSVSYGDDFEWALKDEYNTVLLGQDNGVSPGTYSTIFEGEATFTVTGWGGYGDNSVSLYIEVDGEVEHTFSMSYIPGGEVDHAVLNCDKGYVYTYNVYRDDVKIAPAIEEATFEDTTFDPAQDYTWSVSVVCKKGGEGEWVGVHKDACSTCDKVTNAKAEVGCEATITWTAVEDAKEYKVTRDGNTVTVTEPTYTDEGTFVDGESYTWEIVTVCKDNGESAKVEVTGVANCNSIHELTNSVAIFPNPASGTITIDAKDFARVEIYNTVGQLVETRTISKFDVSSYNTGIYFFKVYDNNNNSVTKRVMVTK